MKKLIVLLLLSFISEMAPAQVRSSEDFEDQRRRRPFCGGLSDSRCFAKPLNSLCFRDPRGGMPGFCRPMDLASDEESLTCVCI